MPISTAHNMKDRVWDEVGPKMIRILRDSYAPIDPATVAEEMFDQIWPDIFKEMLVQVEVATDGFMDAAVRNNFSR